MKEGKGAVGSSLISFYAHEPFDSCGLARLEDNAKEAAVRANAFPWSVKIQCRCFNEHFRRIIVQCHGSVIETEPGTGRSDVILTTASCLLKHTSCGRCEVIKESTNSTIRVSITLASLYFQKNRQSRNVALLFTEDYLKFNNKSSPVCMESNKTKDDAKERCVITSTPVKPDGYAGYFHEVTNYTERTCNKSTTDVCTEISLPHPLAFIREGLTMLCLKKDRWFVHAIGDGTLKNNNTTVLDNISNSRSWIERKVAYIRSNLPDIIPPKRSSR
ncbi:hypothetical protein D918_02023 [Trichuris suis]|nr:hypothetical protein D918_02023 [Trichuris suis]